MGVFGVESVVWDYIVEGRWRGDESRGECIYNAKYGGIMGCER